MKKIPFVAAVIMAGLISTSSFAVDGNEQHLLELASAGETTAALEMIKRKTDVNVPQSDGTTLLHWAVYYNDEALIERLIRGGADVKARNEYGATPFSQAAINANAEILALLLDAGVDPDEKGADGQTALMVVSRTSNTRALEVLLNAGADVNAVEAWRGQTALMWASAQKQPEMVKLLLEHGADPDLRSTLNNWERQVTAEPRMKILPAGGFTALLYAAREGCAECAQHLVNAGAAVDMADPEGVSPLLMATMNAKWDTAKVLLDSGANPNKWDIYGRSPLYATVDYNTLPHGGRADRLSGDLVSNMELMTALVNAGANVNLQLKLFPPYRALGADRGADGLLTTGVTPLFRAARGADIPAMTLLMENGALLNLPNSNGVTPLIVAAGFRQSGIDTRGRFRTEAQAYKATKLLLDTNVVDVNAKERGGQTALFGAATMGWTSVVELLLENGADATVKDQFGNSVVDAAMGRAGMFGRGAGGDQHPETAALLEQVLAKQN